MSQNRKQHYIPQCYLKKFSDNSKSVWAYDKELGTILQPSISNICCGKNLYTITEEFVNENISKGNGITKLLFEKDFFANKYEPLYLQYLNMLEDEAENCIGKGVSTMSLTDEDRLVFANLIAIQFLRLPQIKDFDVNLFNGITPKMLRLFTQGLAKETNNPDLWKLRIEASIQDKAVYHAQTSYLNAELLKKYASDLVNNIWTFSYSKESKFYTSDFPICVNPHKQGVRPIDMGLVQEGVELTFPISKNLMLTIWDRLYFSSKANEDLAITIASEKEIRALNLIRYLFAKRQVYGYTNDFSYIQFVVGFRSGQQYYMNPFK